MNLNFVGIKVFRLIFIKLSFVFFNCGSFFFNVILLVVMVIVLRLYCDLNEFIFFIIFLRFFRIKGLFFVKRILFIFCFMNSLDIRIIFLLDRMWFLGERFIFFFGM